MRYDPIKEILEYYRIITIHAQMINDLLGFNWEQLSLEEESKIEVNRKIIKRAHESVEDIIKNYSVSYDYKNFLNKVKYIEKYALEISLGKGNQALVEHVNEIVQSLEDQYSERIKHVNSKHLAIDLKSI